MKPIARLRHQILWSRWARLRLQLEALLFHSDRRTATLTQQLVNTCKRAMAGQGLENSRDLNTVSQLACRLLPAFPEPSFESLYSDKAFTWLTGCEHGNETGATMLIRYFPVADRLTPIHWVSLFNSDWSKYSVAALCQALLSNDDIFQGNETTLSAFSAQYEALMLAGFEHPLLEWLASTVPLYQLDEVDAHVPSSSPLTSQAWEQAQALLPTLNAGVLISAQRIFDSTTTGFDAVREIPVDPWVMLHTGWLWQLQFWQDNPTPCDDWLPVLARTDALLRQSIETVVLHQLLLPSPQPPPKHREHSTV